MTCDVCRHETYRAYANQIFLGRPDVLCSYCFLAWYEEGIVSEEPLRQRSMQLREIGWPG